MSEWRERVTAELAEVTEKIVKLRRFMATEGFFKLSEEQAELMRLQSYHMTEYADLLSKRLGMTD